MYEPVSPVEAGQSLTIIGAKFHRYQEFVKHRQQTSNEWKIIDSILVLMLHWFT